ncbi:hypothetical protein SAMN04488012_11473 [Palleronia salina]|uniref:Uncharacterized protein n=1 Tax=Palleronia salina TaxID=313368 RepID=A0A1M6L836_9RHOB|nr:hypothetical protein [Palleronia salina]SHJ67352.1 hypothetical protein SAMN04488012_11473 [Palleronia salina]
MAFDLTSDPSEPRATTMAADGTLPPDAAPPAAPMHMRRQVLEATETRAPLWRLPLAMRRG